MSISVVRTTGLFSFMSFQLSNVTYSLYRLGGVSPPIIRSLPKQSPRLRGIGVKIIRNLFQVARRVREHVVSGYVASRSDATHFGKELFSLATHSGDQCGA